ncbi:hypothetical protein PTQ21_18640 [Paenibacillus marchantiae]|uniref:hypothetical protein n=1 Tax=Paenibacillus marchantiae TaxID=3026433 RepID=UPI00237B6615|nr:hypothetical protein [Paenibacillus marchantiae]WDQ30457.1 hypothetical protein PTQ21_18640 [Paenibacillus marchantiae]
MVSTESLLRVDEERITSEEINKLTPFQIFSILASSFLLLLFFYLVFRFITKHDFHGFFVFLTIIMSCVFMGLSSDPDGKAKRRINAARQEKLTGLMNGLPDFISSQVFANEKHDTAIAIDDQSNKLCIIDSEIRVFSSSDILELELVEDDVQLTRTTRGSQVGGAIVGSVLAGGVGAVIGGLSGQKTTSNDKVKRVYLKLMVNDIKRPNVTVDFLNEKKEILKKDKKAIDASNKANHWYGVLSVLIKRG